VFKVVEVPGGIVAATDSGAFLSRDRGMTWALIAESAVYDVRAALDDGDSLLLGTRGSGIVRVPLPQ
jgi:hypothetical protein